jgi:hypothetical protein
MGLGRKLTDAALAKLKQVESALGEDDLSKLTPAQREHYGGIALGLAALPVGSRWRAGRLVTKASP